MSVHEASLQEQKLRGELRKQNIPASSLASVRSNPDTGSSHPNGVVRVPSSSPEVAGFGLSWGPLFFTEAWRRLEGVNTRSECWEGEEPKRGFRHFSLSIVHTTTLPSHKRNYVLVVGTSVRGKMRCICCHTALAGFDLSWIWVQLLGHACWYLWSFHVYFRFLI